MTPAVLTIATIDHMHMPGKYHLVEYTSSVDKCFSCLCIQLLGTIYICVYNFN